MMSDQPKRLRPAARTKAREEVMEHAACALRNFRELEVVRFVIPEPWQCHTPAPNFDAAPGRYAPPVCTVSRERGFVVWQGSRRTRLLVRFYDARNEDVFYGDADGGLWEFVE
jgi:hypothetical protein